MMRVERLAVLTEPGYQNPKASGGLSKRWYQPVTAAHARLPIPISRLFPDKPRSGLRASTRRGLRALPRRRRRTSHRLPGRCLAATSRGSTPGNDRIAADGAGAQVARGKPGGTVAWRDATPTSFGVRTRSLGPDATAARLARAQSGGARPPRSATRVAHLVESQPRRCNVPSSKVARHALARSARG